MDVVKSLLGSKKFIGLVIGLIVMIAAELGLDVAPETLQSMAALIATYIFGQGVADHGKADY